MKKYGLTGNPLGHSISPKVHEMLFNLKNEKNEYNLYPASSLDDCYKDTLKNLNGFNVTVPYKMDIIKYLDNKSQEVELYNACNTVKIEDEKAYGYNTDVSGFLDCFSKNNISFENKNILVVGAGGVASMMAVESARQGGNVFITCRNKEKADILIKRISEKTGKEAKYINKDEVENIDILLNGTPLGMYPDYFDFYLPLNKLKNIPVVFDTVYNPYKTLTVRVSEYYGNFAMGGLHMLVGQAAKAQEIWNDSKFSNDDISRVIDEFKNLIPEFKLNKNIILIGAPGSGKTTLSKDLGKILDAKEIDIDKLIVRRENKSINDIFEDDGEEYFRKVEREVFYNCINFPGNIIATGGGLPEYNDLSKIDRDKNIIVFIDVDVDELVKRTAYEESRPLLKIDKKRAIKNIVEKRYNLYKNSADITIKVEKDSTIEDISVKIIEEVSKNGL